MTGDTPGQDTVLDRLLDLVLVTVLRVWFSHPDSEAPPWYRAQNDPVVGRALRLIHDHPDRPWTVASLASEIGVSRATLARRFAETVGEPPMTYLTDWRMDLAADLLTQPDMTIGAVAQRIGYSTPPTPSAPPSSGSEESVPETTAPRPFPPPGAKRRWGRWQRRRR